LSAAQHLSAELAEAPAPQRQAGPTGRPWVHRFAVTTAVATYLLILIGGLVHGTGSSLACPDWPTCYGTLMPKMEGGVLVEHSHRLAAGTVVVLTLVLAGLLTATRDPALRRLRGFGWLAVGLVFAQALLGGITVLLRLPTPISTAHTATSLLFFMTVLYIAVRSRPHRAGVAAAPPVVSRFALIAAMGVYMQMVLGGLVRHSGAALACTDVPLCRGSLWPDAHPTVLIQALHRLNAVAVACLVLASSIVTFRRSTRPVLRALAVLAPVLVGIQIWLGLHSVTSFLDLATVESHLAVATALLATMVLTVLAARPDGVPAFPKLAWFPAVVQLGKPRITGLVIITFIGGLWLAPGGHIATWRALMTLIGTALLVAASNTFNMYLERDVDPLMERTRDRPLPRATLSPETALAFGTLLACAAVPLVFLGGNLLTGILGLFALGSYVAVYTPLKRTTGIALFIGAVPGALPPLMGWTAATGHLDAPGLALFAILFLWQIPHFLAIAIYRAADYARAGLKVLPLSISKRATRVTIVVFSIGLVAATIALQPLHVAGPMYLGVAALLGAGFIGWAAAGFRRAAENAWARSLFFYSIIYLTLLFVAIVVDRTIA
jgi:protoheme IX farnesyltransferase